MPFARLLGTLAVLTLLGACQGPPPTGSEPLQLPELEQLETTAGVPFEVSLAATGGTPPLRHSLETLPPGLFFYVSEGLLKGTATLPGLYTFTVQVKDAAGATEASTYRLLVQPAPAVSTTSLPTATAGEAYAVRLEASGGKWPLRWTLVGGSLPSGLSLGEDGQLTGVPQQSGSYSPSVRVQDVHGAQATRVLGLLVRPGTPDGGGGGGGDGGTDGGTSLTFSAANWNIEWFGDPAQGPADDALQLDNVKTVITTTGADFWGLAELVDATEFNALKQMPGYDGFMANDPLVVSGASYYSAGEQKVGFLFRSDVVSVQDARIILTSSNYDFGSRPPLQVKLRLTRNGMSMDLVAIMLHMKAFSDTDSYNRRYNAALALKGYLDTELRDVPFIVLGDWNDDVDVSITKDSTSGTYLPTPFQNFLDDPADYTFVTQPLSLANVRSTVSNPQFIDHQLISNELRTGYVSNSAQALQPTISQYKDTTSDHYPVFSRFAFNVEPPPPPPPESLRLTFPNGGEQFASSTVQTLTWTADGVSTVLLEFSPDNGVTWREVASSVPAASGQYTWTVPSVLATAQARVRVSDASAPETSDQSDAAFTVSGPPAVFINEYLPHEPPVPGGTERDYAQQFVEVVNGSTSTVDLMGWMVHDRSSVTGTAPRHLFTQETLLGPGKALVVYSGPTAIPAGATNAVEASSGGLFFNKGKNHGGQGDAVYLQDGAKQEVDSASYEDSTEAVSYNRSPDAARAGVFELHNVLNPALGSSPGKRANGSDF